MKLATDFYNKVLLKLDSKYFPGLQYYRDSPDCAKLHYQTELFSNGCLDYDTYVKRAAKLCNDSVSNIAEIVDSLIINKPTAKQTIYGVVSNGVHVDISKSERGAKNYATRHNLTVVTARYNGNYSPIIVAEKVNGKWKTTKP